MSAREMRRKAEGIFFLFEHIHTLAHTNAHVPDTGAVKAI